MGAESADKANAGGEGGLRALWHPAGVVRAGPPPAVGNHRLLSGPTGVCNGTTDQSDAGVWPGWDEHGGRLSLPGGAWGRTKGSAAAIARGVIDGPSAWLTWAAAQRRALPDLHWRAPRRGHHPDISIVEQPGRVQR